MSGIITHRNDGTPRGQQTVSPRARAGARLVLEEGKSAPEVARIYGVKVGTVRKWVADVRALERDQWVMGGIREKGTL